MVSTSKVAVRDCGEYHNQAVFLEIATHLSFSSNIHYSMTLTVNNSKAPTFQLVRHGAVSKGRSGSGWRQPQKRGHREKMSRPELLLFIHIRNEDGRMPAWPDLLRPWTQYVHPAIFHLGQQFLFAPPLSLLLFLDFNLLEWSLSIC